MTQYMLMFSLGPVQSFTAQAGKTRDLWLGSCLLSTLMEDGMKGINESSLVFPANPTIRKNVPDLPNKFVAIFNTLIEAQDTAKRTRDQIEQCWVEICQDIWREIVEKHARFRTSSTQEIWKRQTNPANFFEIFWVIVEGDPKLYDQWLQRTQEALDARKQLRDFRRQDEPGEKSTISGEREALHGAGASRLDVQTFWYELTKDLPEKDISKDGTERLDAIDTIKRFATLSRRLQEKHLQADFPSTSSVATASFVKQLIEKAPNSENLSLAIEVWLKATTKPFNEMPPSSIPYLKRQADKQKQMLEVLQRDGDCYFLETFTLNHLKKDYGFSLGNEDERHRTQQRSTNAQHALKELLNAADDFAIPFPTPYYAILQMDGDRMGRILNGVKDRNAHVSISKTLSTFAREVVPPIVEGNRPGRLVYVGGDDVLAFSPLEHLLDLADQLQREYRSNISKVVAEGKREEATASTGIAIANHLTPLSAVLQATRESEKLAKDRYGRNALVVTLMRLFLEPLEPLLFRRTGRSFDAGESGFADTFFPPTPETLQGAIRAAIATHWDRTKTLAELFQQEELIKLIGDRSSYGRFRITGLALGRISNDGSIERLFPAPAHLFTFKGQDGQQQLIRLQPDPEKAEGVYTNCPDGMQLLYPNTNVQGKLEPLGGWLTEHGLMKALRTKEELANEEKVSDREIFEYESRLGIGMNNATKSTREGLLYQVQMLRMKLGYGFLVDIRVSQSPQIGIPAIPLEQMDDDSQTQQQLRLPDSGWITLGGERRAARFIVVKSLDLIEQGTLEQVSKGNLIYLATPAAFSGGWQPGQWPNSTKPIAAAIHRYQLIGGWSLRPGNSGGENKSIRRCVPAGSIYYFDRSVSVTQPLTEYGWQIGYGIVYAGGR